MSKHNQEALDLLHGVREKAFVACFASSIVVEGRGEQAVDLAFHLIPAASEAEARRIAERIQPRLGDATHNAEGRVVETTCRHIYSVLEADFVDLDGTLDLGGIVFTPATRIEHLAPGSQRPDLRGLD